MLPLETVCSRVRPFTMDGVADDLGVGADRAVHEFNAERAA
ncbi:MAG: hypothetical protein ACRDF0_09215 [Candidatus Limnocylindria bacterium]